MFTRENERQYLRLDKLVEALRGLGPDHYYHGAYVYKGFGAKAGHMQYCALGLAVTLKDIFPGLHLQFSGYNIVLAPGYEHLSVRFVTDKYFGRRANQYIFRNGCLSSYKGTPNLKTVIRHIRTFQKKMLRA
jgi:hypothetical protein